MAGGKGSRLGGLRKYLLEVCGRRMIEAAIKVAIRVSNGGKVYVCTRWDDVDKISNYLTKDVEVVKCDGLGYVEDLNMVLQMVRFPVLVLPADIPYLTPKVITEFLNIALKENADVVTLMVCKDNICRETGISLFRNVGGSWVNVYFNDRLDLMDVDTSEDLKLVRELCGSMEGIGRQS